MSRPPLPADDHAAGPAGAAWWIGLLVGGAVMAYGVWGALDDAARTSPGELAVWVVGAALVHDLVLAPAVTLAALAAARLLPAGVRGPVQGATAASGVVLLFSWPLLRGYGRREANPSILPLDYQRNVVIVLAGIWAVALVVGLVRARQRRRAPEVEA